LRFPTSPARFEAAMTDWRTFGARRFRSFHVLALAQGLIGVLSGPAIAIPLLLKLGAHPALVTALAVLPVIGTMAQRFVPPLLERTNGNMRGIVALAASVGEPRGLVMALIVLLAAGGVLPGWLAITLIGLVLGVLGALGSIAFGMLHAWYGLVLADEDRRLVAPRLGGITLGIGSVVLVPFALSIDWLFSGIGLAAYAIPLGIAGTAGVVASVMLRRLPSPGRVRVPRAAAWRAADETGRLRRHGRIMSLALLSAGLSPFLAVYAMVVLGTGAGFAIGISAVSSASLVASSLFVSSRLARSSSSRMLRNSFLLRSGALFLGLLAFPANPFAPLLIMLVAVLLAMGDTAGQLSANERLMRLASGPSVIAFQSHYVVPNVLSYAAGIGIASLVMLLGGYASFAILFAAAGSSRLVAARVASPRPEAVSEATEAHAVTGP
jgi:hypothetical protein